MERQLEFLGKTALAVIIGLVILVALLTASMVLLVAMEYFFITSSEPSPERSGVASFGPGFLRFVIAIVVLYLFSVCTASFVSGLFLRREDWGVTYQVLYASFCGLIIGSVVPFYMSGFFALESLFWGLPGILGVLAGYFIASRKFSRVASK